MNSKEGKFATKAMMKKNLQPLNEALKAQSARLVFLLRIKDAKIPFYEKLPKDNQFYRHYMNGLQFTNMSHKMEDVIEQDKNLFEEAAETIMRET